MTYRGSDLVQQEKDSIELCAVFASETEEALYWTYELKTKKCFLKTSNSDRGDNTPGHVSGSSECGFAKDYNYDTVGEYPHSVDHTMAQIVLS